MIRRREFLIGTALVSGGVLVGGYRLVRPLENPLIEFLDDSEFALTPYVIIDASGVTIVAPRAEMGQGIHTTLAALVAEELDISLGDVRVIAGPASNVYANQVLYPPVESFREIALPRIRERLGRLDRTMQLTGGQTSIQDAFVKMRMAGAAARHMLMEAAAHEGAADRAMLRTEGGSVIYPDGSSKPYTALAASAARLPSASDISLKPRSEWKVLGRSQPRVDMAAKCTGEARYSIDVRLPGMLFGVVRRNPHLGAELRRMDAATAVAMAGVREVIRLEDGVIVIATNTWHAMQAARAVHLEWDSAPYPENTAEHRAALLEAIRDGAGRRWRDDGDVDRAFSGAEIVAGSYHVPYLAHATMEPLNAIAWLREGRLDIWAGNQEPTGARYLGAKLAGLSTNAVRVHTTFMGGGFGRRLEADFIGTAIRAALAIPGAPILVTWPREEDMTHDVYRPIASAAFRASVSNDRPVAIDLTLCSPGLHASLARRSEKAFEQLGDGDEYSSIASSMGAFDQPYAVENYRVTTVNPRRLLPVGWWRSVGESQNCFFTESIFDELANVMRTDPLEMRLSLIEHTPSRAVLEAVAQMSGWGSRLPPDRARGLAYARSSGAATAQVVEVSWSGQAIRVERCWAVVDVGIALDPRNVEAQITSAVLFGLCAAIHGEVTVSEGAVTQSNFHDYPILRMNEVPPVDVRVYESGGEIFGVGESATPTSAPALGNAIFAATGQRIRELPFGRSIDFV